MANRQLRDVLEDKSRDNNIAIAYGYQNQTNQSQNKCSLKI